jgi:UDP-glucose 4-epimerase
MLPMGAARSDEERACPSPVVRCVVCCVQGVYGLVNNLGGLVTVSAAMQRHGVKRFVFSSSATVYGDPASVPITEAFPLKATNPYGRTKLMIEDILRVSERAARASWG